jgi:hypothetical protein
MDYHHNPIVKKKDLIFNTDKIHQDKFCNGYESFSGIFNESISVYSRKYKYGNFTFVNHLS